jgi:hypothetical protein
MRRMRMMMMMARAIAAIMMKTVSEEERPESEAAVEGLAVVVRWACPRATQRHRTANTALQWVEWERSRDGARSLLLARVAVDGSISDRIRAV